MTGDKEKNSEAGFGSRFFSGLKDLIIEDEAPKGPAATAKPPEPAITIAAKNATVASATPPPLPPQANQAMQNNLMEVVMSRATAYTALTEAMTPLEEIIPDEMTRYRAAFAVIKKNRSLDQLIQAIDMQHMQILEGEVARFAGQAKQKEAADVDTRLNEARTLKGNIDAANAQAIKIRQELENKVRAIEEGIQRDQHRLEEIDREVEEKRQAIGNVQRQFDYAAEAVKTSLQQAKAKIIKYLSA